MNNNYVSIDDILKNFYESPQQPTDFKKFCDMLLLHNPCRPSWLNREFVTIKEATLIYFGIDPDALAGNEVPIIQKAIIFWDFDNQIEMNLQQYCLVHQKYEIVPGSILMSDFKTFLIKKNYKIPSHFTFHSLQNEERSKPEEISPSNINSNEKNKKKRVYDPFVLRKEAIALKAKIFWYKEKQLINHGKLSSTTKPNNLIKNKKFLEFVIEVYIELQCPPLNSKKDNLIMDEFEKVKNDQEKFREYLGKCALNPASLIDVDWISPHKP